MAHVGEEPALRFHGGLQLRRAFLNLRFQIGIQGQYLHFHGLAFGNVQEYAMRSLETSVAVPLDVADDMHNHCRAIITPHGEVAIDEAPGLEMIKSGRKPVGGVVLPEIAKVEPQQVFRPLETQQLGQHRVGVQPLALDIQ